MRSMWAALIDELINIPAQLSALQGANPSNEIVNVIQLDELKALIIYKTVG